jgi:tRNA modification GTPase
LSNHRDTIFALSSGRPPAAIAVIRISGPGARESLMATMGRLPQPRRATFARLHDPAGEEIDEALVLWFPGPQSETGEDMAELQVHGGRAIVARLLAVLGGLPGFRMAEAGEFTRRAFANGRLDLTAVEGLGDLINADTEAQRQQALRQFKGLLGNQVETWRSRLIEAMAMAEAAIDFADEGDVPGDLGARALAIIRPLLGELRQAAGAGRGERLREGLAVAIAGPPNVGKSTLLNRLARREAAIVSPHAGTTRDVIEVHLDLGGFPVILRDTAGLREAIDPVEQEGVRRARDAVLDADLVLWVWDAAGGEVDEPSEQSDLEAVPPRWIILNKMDLLAPGAGRELVARLTDRRPGHPLLTISATFGAGIDELVRNLSAFAEHFFTAEPALVTRERHRLALQEAAVALEGALQLGPQGGEELVAEQIRLATRALERLTGRIGVEDILDVIFRDFCIGK